MCDICDAMGQRVEADGSIVRIGEAKSDREVLAAFVKRAAGCSVCDGSSCALPAGNEIVQWLPFGDPADSRACVHCVGVLDFGQCEVCGGGTAASDHRRE